MTSVLFITRTYSDRPGGMQTYAKTLLRALRDRPDVAADDCVYRGGAAALPFFAMRALWCALTTLRNTVLLGDAVLAPLCIVMSLLRPRVRRVVIVHGLDLTWRFPLYRTIVGFSLRYAHRVVAVSTSTADIARGLGISPDRITVIPCPVPPAQPFASARVPRRLLILGRLIPRKGARWFLLHVLPLLRVRHPDLTVVIAGHGPDRQAIDALLRTSPHRDAVTVTGSVPDTERDRLLSEASLLVVPNITVPGDTEGFGIVCLEAAIRGLPVVAAHIDGLPDAVQDRVTGILFPSGSPDACVSAIEDALRIPWNPETMQRFVLDHFAPSVIVSRFIRDAL